MVHAKLASFAEHDEVVLWAERDLRDTRLSAICPADERLGTLDADRIRGLFDTRAEVTPAMLTIGAELWRHVAADAPAPKDFSAWPLLERVLSLRAQRERDEAATILTCVGTGPKRAGEVFRDFYQTDLGKALGMGDHQFAVALVRLQSEIAIEPPPGRPPYRDFGRWLIRPSGPLSQSQVGAGRC